MGAPILDFKVEDLLDDDKFELFGEILNFWILTDHHNVHLYKMGMRSVSMPGRYTTNEVPLGRSARYFLNYAPPEIRARAEESASELLQWLAYVRFNDQDYLGTLRATLALRHHDASDQTLASDMFTWLRMKTTLDAAMGTGRQDPSDYVFAPFDKILAELRGRVSPAATDNED